jgi:hypothetical protein
MVLGRSSNDEKKVNRTDYACPMIHGTPKKLEAVHM